MYSYQISCFRRTFSSIFTIMEFNFIPKTLYLMRFFGLFPPKNQESTKFKDVVYIFCLAFSLWFVLGGSYAYLYANIHTATVDIMTDNMYTNFIYQMMCSNYLLMSIGRFSIRDLINELEIIVTKSKIGIYIFSNRN